MCVVVNGVFFIMKIFIYFFINHVLIRNLLFFIYEYKKIIKHMLVRGMRMINNIFFCNSTFLRIVILTKTLDKGNFRNMHRFKRSVIFILSIK